MFDHVNGFPSFPDNLFEADPDQDGTGDVIANDPCFAALAAFQSHQLLCFAIEIEQPHSVHRDRQRLGNLFVILALIRQEHNTRMQHQLVGHYDDDVSQIPIPAARPHST